MAKIEISTNDEIDYSPFLSRLNKIEVRTPTLVKPEKVVNLLNRLPKHFSSQVRTLYTRQNDLNVHSYPFIKSRTGILTHPHWFIYKYGLVTFPGYQLVEVDLNTSLTDIIRTISHSEDVKTKYIPEEMTEKIANIITTIGYTDELYIQALEDLLNLEIPEINLMMYKAIKLSKRKQKIITNDLFNIQRTYRDLSALESFLIPIAYSYQTLIPALIEKLSSKYFRRTKRLGCIDRNRLYYFVRNEDLEEFLTMQLIVDGCDFQIFLRVINEFGVEGNNDIQRKVNS